MNSMKMKVLEEILSHLDDSQGGDLKSLMDMPAESPEGAIAGADSSEEIPGKPQGMSVEKVSVMGGEKDPSMDDMADSGVPADAGMPKEDDMSDEELEEMLRSLS